MLRKVFNVFMRELFYRLSTFHRVHRAIYRAIIRWQFPDIVFQDVLSLENTLTLLWKITIEK